MTYDFDDYDDFENVATSFGAPLGQWRGTEDGWVTHAQGTYTRVD